MGQEHFMMTKGPIHQEDITIVMCRHLIIELQNTRNKDSFFLNKCYLNLLLITSQFIHISNHFIVYLKLIQCFCQLYFNEKNKNKNKKMVLQRLVLQIPKK